MSYNIYKDLKIFDVKELDELLLYSDSTESNVLPKSYERVLSPVSPSYDTPEKLLGNLWKYDRSGLSFPNIKGKEDFIDMGLKAIGTKDELNMMTLKITARISLEDFNEEVKKDYEKLKTLIDIKIDKKTNDYYKGDIILLKGILKDNFDFYTNYNFNKFHVYVDIKKRTKVPNTIKSLYKQRYKIVTLDEMLKIVDKSPLEYVKIEKKHKDFYLGKGFYVKQKADGSFFFLSRRNSRKGVGLDYMEKFKDYFYKVFI